MDEEGLQKHIDEAIKAQNNRPTPHFEGYSPAEMHQILYYTFGAESQLQLKTATDEDYRRVPILSQVKYLAGLIEESGALKLTAKGFLPTKVVADIYQQGFLKEDHIESGIYKLYKETDAITINLTRILIEMAGLVKKGRGWKERPTSTRPTCLTASSNVCRTALSAATYAAHAHAWL